MPVQTMTMGPGTLSLGEAGSLQQLESQLTNCRVSPSVDTGDPINVLSGEQAPGDRTESFTLAGTLVQDFGNVESVTEWTWQNRGQQVPFTFTPNTAKGRSITGTVTVEAVEIGGDVKTKPTSDFEWTIIGAPDLGAAA